ncbi:MAG: hypothetical protein ACRCSV_04830 [Chlamydiales bacterium]
MNTAFLLITDPHIKEQQKAKQILSAFFLEDNSEVDFLIEQFINWVTEQPSKMSNCLNEAAFQTAGGNREIAISTIKNYFSSEKPEVIEFATAFVDWGTELLKMNTIFNPENKKL